MTWIIMQKKWKSAGSTGKLSGRDKTGNAYAIAIRILF